MKKKNITTGLILVLVAFLILLNALGLLVNITLWQIILSIVLIFIFVKSLLRLQYFGIFISAALMLLLYHDDINVPIVSPFLLILGSIVIALGFNILTKADDEIDIMQKNTQDVIDNDGTVKFSSSFSISTKYLHAQNVELIDLNNSFGQMNIYLNDVTFNQELKVNVNNSFGETVLFIPEEYYVIPLVNSTLATINSVNNIISKDEGLNVIITGDNMLGSITIIRLRKQ